ncbi:ribosomal-protein-alanine N-acetyltransferase [Rhodoligotrophos appendicifer]|uniref:GNAT family N-acetyltransferase n=1 Tax=Rhodoligotrophos appendicifer TaxID=987056 RepID=UPI00117CC51F|nr:GNAT family N-acetyltransferase [Rhodoligotrophos appendicifer]
MTVDAEVRLAGAGDVPVLAAIHAACFEDGWSRAEIAKLLAMPGSYCLMAMQQEEALGLAILRHAADEAEILSIGVVPEARQRGLGRGMIEAALAIAARSAIKMMFIEVDATNEPALALYRGMGFTECGRRRGYYRYADGSHHDALNMRCAVAPSDRS